MGGQTIIQIHENTLLLEKHTSKERRSGRLLMGLAVLLYSAAHFGYRKLAEEGFGPHEVILFRSLVATGACIVLGRVLRVPHAVIGPRGSRLFLFVRGGLGLIGLLLFLASLEVLPQSDAVTLSFLSPFISVVMAHLFLKESLSGVSLMSTILGFVGVAGVYRPEFLNSTANITMPGLLLAVLSSLANVGSTVLIRKAGKGTHFLHLLGYFSILPVFPAITLCLLQTESLMSRVSLQHCGWGLAASLASLSGSILFTLSLQRERVAVVTNFTFLPVLFDACLGFPLSTLAILLSIFFATHT
ncbi:hypothetical protein DSO57_1036819 [Entomophthora muscae]|uniref:Uncharacterized protein n=1 Tax=Entomophthora muscae TaxID=34485 RepID=A0ACC2TA81_9FUNG|nr:hypothetical protein DSO57_1036819 [Entomophthora muscae]